MTDNEKQFILALRELSLKHRVVVGGCGCCGSPWVVEIKEEAAVPEAGYAIEIPSHGDISWLSPSGTCWEEHHDKILKP